MKFALAGGGTGGHAYPAFAVAERLSERVGTELVYYGSERGPERDLAGDRGLPYRAVSASQLRGRSPWRVLRGTLNLLRGGRQARRLLAADRPDALFATGGYASAPIGRAARASRIPMLLFLPDVKPGWAVRFMQRYATIVACSVEASLRYLPPRRTVVTGYPVRKQFGEISREGGAERFGLDPAVHTVLVTGGSQGAHQINRAIAQALRPLLERAQLIHICGRDEERWLRDERERLPAWQQDRYQLLAYTEEMAAAMAAADLAVTRAGASVLGELPAAGLPAIVIPLGLADQHHNAQYLAEQGAAFVLPSTGIDRLHETLLDLLSDDRRRAEMAAAARRLARPDAAERLATMLREMAA